MEEQRQSLAPKDIISGKNCKLRNCYHFECGTPTPCHTTATGPGSIVTHAGGVNLSA